MEENKRIIKINNPLISIVVPVYNVPELFLRKCIESILLQSMENIEIILVDDGSTDHSGKICEEYKDKDTRIKVIHQKNEGLSAARNTGVKAALGKWITFVDGDDWLSKETCERIYQEAEETGAEIVCWGIVREYSGKQERYEYREYFENKKVYENAECKYMQEMLLHFNARIATSCAKFILREYLLKYEISHDENIRQGAEDLEFCFRLFDKAKKILFIDECLYHYRYNPNSISAKSTEDNNECILKCFEKIQAVIEESEYKEEFYQWFYNRLDYVIVTTAISGYFHPDNQESFWKRRKKFLRYLEHSMLQNTLKEHQEMDIGIRRKIILFLIRKRMFLMLELLGIIRQFQKMGFRNK